MADLVALTHKLEFEDDPAKLLGLLKVVAKAKMTVDLLRQTGIGKTVGSSRLKKHSDAEVASSARAIIEAWNPPCGLQHPRHQDNSTKRWPCAS
jgi:hypothetical protein